MTTINIIGVVMLVGSVLGYGALFLWVLAGRNARKTRFQPLDRICDEHRKEERRQDKGYVKGGVGAAIHSAQFVIDVHKNGRSNPKVRKSKDVYTGNVIVFLR